MVFNDYVRCNVCDTKFRLRIQAAERDIKFSFACPKCSTIISGKYVFDQKRKEEHVLRNCKRDEHSDEKSDFVQELSAEFLQRKIEVEKSDDPTNNIQLTPFMRTLMLVGDDMYSKILEKEKFLKIYETYYNDLVLIEDLYINKKFDILKYKLLKGNLPLINFLRQTLSDEINFICKNELDMIIIIHQARNLLITNLIDSSRKERILNAPHSVLTQVFDKITLVEPLVRFLGDKGYFNDFNLRMLEVTRNYAEILPYLTPVIFALDYCNKVLKKGDYVISIEIFRDVTNLYQKMYELFCDGIDLVIGLNNIAVRGNHNLFFLPKNNLQSFEDVINSYSSKYLKYTEQLHNEPFTGDLLNVLSNVIRNSEGHFDRTFDFDKNEVVFRNKHKGNENILRIDYVIFITDFIKLFNATNELFEYSYQLEKIYHMRCKNLKLNYGRTKK